LEALRRRPSLVILALGFTYFDGLFMNIMIAFAPSFLSRSTGGPTTLSMAGPAVALVLMCITIPLAAALGDLMDRRAVFAVGALLTAASSYWSFYEVRKESLVGLAAFTQ